MRLPFFGILVLAMAFTAPIRAQEQPVFRLELRNHRFEPAEITVPADKRLILMVRNADDTPAEFESKELSVEKVISPGREATIRLGPLAPGRYAFIDEFNQTLARGVLIAKPE